jgi:CDP-glycerol glycerophosphotransferase
MDHSGNNHPISIEQRLAALERQLLEQKLELEKHGRSLSTLDLWQQGKLFGYIARLYPKNRSVIFLHTDFFADNTKYAFLAFRKIAEKHDVACHFLINNNEQRTVMQRHGLPVLPPLNEWGIEQLRLLMGTKVIVACNHFTPFSWTPPVPYFLMQGARLIQMWHGIPFKEIGFLYSDNPAAGAFNSLRISSTGPADVFVAPNAAMREQWRQWFAFHDFAALGYPRNDTMFHEATGDELVNVDLDLLREVKAAREAGRKVILYTPTFRDSTGTPWLQRLDLPAFNKWCESKGYLLIVKLHPIENANFEERRAALPGVRLPHPYSDIYPFLRHSDMLITDYSSLALDYLLLNRPIVFCWPDLEDYKTQCRAMLPDFESRVAGERVTDAESLRRVVEHTLAGNDAWREKRQTLARQLFDQHDGGSSDRVARLILEQVDAPEQLPQGWGI